MGVEDFTPLHQYLTSIHFALTLLQGDTDIVPGQVLWERLCAVILLFVSILVLAALLSNLTNVMIEFHTKHHKQKQIREYLTRHHVSPDLSVRVRRYVELMWRTDAERGQAEDRVLTYLPSRLRREVLEHVRSASLVVNPIFHAILEFHARCFERICCDEITCMWAHPDQEIFSYHEQCHAVYFVLAGRLTYYKYNPLLKKFLASGLGKNGPSKKPNMGRKSFEAPYWQPWWWPTPSVKEAACDWQRPTYAGTQALCGRQKVLCESVLWTHWLHKGDLFAECQSAVLTLAPQGFEKVVTSYAEVLAFCKVHATRFVRALVLQAGGSDLFDSLSIKVDDP